MLSEEIDYRTSLDGRFTQIRHLRAFGPWELLTAGLGTAPTLLLVNDEAHTATLCLYDDPDERTRDICWVSGLPPDGAAGVLARLNPPPPSLALGEARPLPGFSPADDDGTGNGRP